MKVILIDGPKAGEVYEVPGGYHAFVAPVFHSPRPVEYFRDGMAWHDETFARVIYNLHRIRIFDFELTVGTTKTRQDMLGSDEWNAVMAELGRQSLAA